MWSKSCQRLCVCVLFCRASGCYFQLGCFTTFWQWSAFVTKYCAVFVYLHVDVVLLSLVFLSLPSVVDCAFGNLCLLQGSPLLTLMLCVPPKEPNDFLCRFLHLKRFLKSCCSLLPHSAWRLFKPQWGLNRTCTAVLVRWKFGCPGFCSCCFCCSWSVIPWSVGVLFVIFTMFRDLFCYVEKFWI